MRLKEPQKNCRSKLLVHYHEQGTRSRHAALVMRCFFFFYYCSGQRNRERRKGGEGVGPVREFPSKRPVPGKGRLRFACIPAERPCTSDILLCAFPAVSPRTDFFGGSFPHNGIKSEGGRPMRVQLLPFGGGFHRCGRYPVFTSPELR